MRALLFALAAVLALGASASAQLTVDQPWATPSAPGQDRSAAYFVLRSAAQTDDRLVGVQSEAATAELHGYVMDGDVARMTPLEAVELPAGGEVAFAPGGNHVMLMGLSEPLEFGDTLTIILTFEQSGSVEVTFPVESLASHLAGLPEPEPATLEGDADHIEPSEH